MIIGSHVDVFLRWVSAEGSVRVAYYWHGNIQMPTLRRQVEDPVCWEVMIYQLFDRSKFFLLRSYKTSSRFPVEHQHVLVDRVATWSEV